MINEHKLESINADWDNPRTTYNKIANMSMSKLREYAASIGVDPVLINQNAGDCDCMLHIIMTHQHGPGYSY